MVEFRFGNSERSARRKSAATAFIFMGLGLGLGALIGLLSAPKSGKMLRKDMQRKAEEARDAVEKLGKRAGDLIERGEEFAESAARKAEPVTRIFRRA